MNLKIYNKIELLTYDKNHISVEKVEFENASINFTGNFMVITAHDMTAREKTTCTPYDLSYIKAYKTK